MVKKIEIRPSVRKSGKLKNSILREISLSLKSKQFMFSLIYMFLQLV